MAFGNRNEDIAAGLASGLAAYPKIAAQLDPNSVQLNRRIEEVVVLVLVTFILTLKSWRSEQLVLRQAELAGERANLSRYFPPNMVDMLASRHHDIGGVRSVEIAVLFADIVGFTKMAEALPPDRVLNLLRHYYAAIEKAVFDNHGTLDKYLGDGVMVTFGTPEPGSQDALNALRAARAIIAAIDAMATEDQPGDAPRLRVSVGLHFGRATIGDVGPARRLEFAMLGDTVNVASRLEAATRDVGCRILCSDDLMQRVGDDPAAQDFTRHIGIILRGRTTPIDGWTYGNVPSHLR